MIKILIEMAGAPPPRRRDAPLNCTTLDQPSVLTSRLNFRAGLVLKGLRSTVLWCLGVARARRA